MSVRSLPRLFTPLEFRDVRSKNRVICAAQLTGLAEEGRPSAAQVNYYAERARGGAGLIVFESTPVHASGASFGRLVRPYEPGATPGLARLAEAVHEEGALILGQLWHCGRQGSSAVTGMALLAPSAVASAANRETPRELTRAEIDELSAAFAATARVFERAGFDGVEVAAGHGYLVHQFLSPLANRRTDDYGGSLENRTRFLLEIIERIRAACSSRFLLSVRLSADEFQQGGFDLAESIALVRRLNALNSPDLLSVSAGTHAAAEQMVGDWSVRRGNLVPLAGALRQVAAGVPVAACGRIVDPDQAEAVLRDGAADAVALARALIADPHWPAKAAGLRVKPIRPCIACNQCEARLFSGLPIGCAVNPSLSANDDDIPPAARRRKVVIVGGGPAGMEAARVAALRGHHVRLYEQADSLGGQLRLLQQLGTRDEFLRLIPYFEVELSRLEVEIFLGRRADAAELAALAPDAIILATGSTATRASVSDGLWAETLVPEDLHDAGGRLGAKVAVIDGGASHDYLLAVVEAVLRKGREVALITERPALGPELNFISLAGILKRLKAGGARLFCATRVLSFKGGELELQALQSGERHRLQGIESVIRVTSHRSETALLEALKGTLSELTPVGDCVAPRGFEDAFREGHAAALTA